MIRCEALILTIPEITQDEIKSLESLVNSVTSKNQATVVSFEKWGKYRLAYPVKKNDYGVYFLARVESTHQPDALLEELRTLFAVKLNEMVMRSMISSLSPQGSLAYQRPPSLEEAPAKELGGYMREGRGDYDRPDRDFRRSPQDVEASEDFDEEEN